MSSELKKKIFYNSCFDELQILKPGNHSIFSKIIGMYTKKFLHSAKVTSEILVDDRLTLGQSIFFSAKKKFR